MTSPAVCENTAPLGQSKLPLLPTALGGPNQRKARSFVSEPATKKNLQSLAQLSPTDLEKMLMNILDEETTIGLNEEELLADTGKTVSFTVSEGKPPTAAVPCKDIANVTSLTKTAEIISDVNPAQIESSAACKITAEKRTSLFPHPRRWNKTDSKDTCLQDCRILSYSTTILQDSRELSQSQSSCKTANKVDLYFSNHEKKSKEIKIIKMAKNEIVYPENPLQRWLFYKTDKAIKAEVCSLCDYAPSKRQMHTHFRQHFTKHFCTCGYNSMSYDSVYRHRTGQSCTAAIQDMHEVDKHSYPRFLRLIKWKPVPAFGEWTSTLHGDGRRTLTYRRSIEPRRPVKERLGRQVDVSRIHTPEMERLRAQVEWHEQETI